MQDTHTHSEISFALNTPTSKGKGVAFKVANTTGAMMVHQSPINSVSGKLGVEMGCTIGAGNLYARFDLHHAFTGNMTTQYNHASILIH